MFNGRMEFTRLLPYQQGLIKSAGDLVAVSGLILDVDTCNDMVNIVKLIDFHNTGTHSNGSEWNGTNMFRSRGYTNNNSSLDWDWSMIDQGSRAGPGVLGSDNNMMDGSADGKRQ
eukprot:scaffold54452_cov34-Attheya_sp.AAC.1